MVIKALRAHLPVCCDKDNMRKTETVSDKAGCKDTSRVILSNAEALWF